MARYHLIRRYNDNTIMSENTNELPALFAAIAIYLEDPNCIQIKVIDNMTNETIVKYWKDNKDTWRE